jgi:hypothetical protein
VEDEVDWTDLVMLEILRLHEPTVYDLVLDKLDRLTGEKSSLSDDKKWAEDLVPTAVNSADFRTAKEALMTLFPRLAEVWEPNTGSWRKDHHALRNRRLQCAEYARNYFSLAPAPDQFTTGQINGLFRAENSLEAFNALFDQAKTRKTRQGLTMVSRLLQQIREQITRKNPMPQALIRAVLAKGDEIVRIRDSERMLFEVNNALRLSWVMVEALRAVPESDRATVFLSWFNGLDGAYVLAEFISSMTSKARTSSDSIFPDVDHEVLREKALLTMRSLSAEPDFIRKPQGAMVLFTWGHLAGFDEVASWVKGRLKDDRAVLDLAAIMPSEVYSSPGGLWYRIDRKGWSLIVDVDAFSERLRSMAKKKGLADGDLAIIKAYEDALAKGTDDRY